MTNTTGYGSNFFRKYIDILNEQNSQALQDFMAMNPPASTAQVTGGKVMSFRTKDGAMASKNAYAKLSPEEKKIADNYLRTKDKPGAGLSQASQNQIAKDVGKGRG